MSVVRTAEGASWVPSEPLRRYVRRYEGYRMALDARAVHHGEPSPTATVIINLDAPIRLGWGGGPTERHQVLLCGLHTRPAVIRTDGTQHGIQLSLTPRGVRALLGVPVAAAHEVLTDPAELVAADRRRREMWSTLAERLAGLRSWTARFELLDALLLTTLDVDAAGMARPEVARAWHRLTADPSIPVSDLAAETGWSRRHLTAQFAGEHGVGVKQAARLLRRERARRLAPQLGLAEAAARAGYADQSHLSRDWVALSGRTPRQSLDSPFFVPG